MFTSSSSKAGFNLNVFLQAFSCGKSPQVHGKKKLNLCFILTILRYVLILRVFSNLICLNFTEVPVNLITKDMNCTGQLVYITRKER